MKNYHTHTRRCHHAFGTDKEFVKKAIKAGFDELGFSDHAPMLFPVEKYYSNFRMSPDKAEGYINSIKALREEYKNEIKIHIGCEIEYYPKCTDKTIEWLEGLGCEYFILGQHFTDNEFEPEAHYNGRETDSVELFDKYISQALQGLATGKFLYIAHPDLFKYTGPDNIYIEKMTYFCKEIKKLGYPVEFNLLGFEDKRNYPDKRFWEIVSKVGNDVVIGFDAHKPTVLQNKKLYDSAIKYLADFNITPIELTI
jgi:histidinol-phosphatase (PHP family)